MQRWLLILLLAAALAAFGGANDESTLPLFLGALVVAVAGWRRTFSFPRSNRLLDLALVATALAIALQLVPLPPPVIDALAPDALRIRNTLRLDAAMLEGRAVPLSINPAGTVHALLTFLGAVLVFWSVRGGLAGGGLRRVCRAIAFLGLLLALEAVLQRALSPRAIYGVWRVPDFASLPLGPFANKNYFAGWLVLAIPLVAGYLAARVRIRIADSQATSLTRVLAAAGAPLVITLAAMVVALSTSLSRSALAGLGAATLMAWAMARKRIEVAPRLTLPVLGALGLALVFVMAFVDLDQWTARIGTTFSPTETRRMTIWRESLPVARDFWLTGVGAGAYSMAMLVYQQSVIPMPHFRTFAHMNQAHSHYVQVAVEGALLLAIPVVVALIALARAGRAALASDRGEALWIRVGAAAGLVGIAVQSVWETSLRMPANAMLCAVLAGVLVHRRERDHYDASRDSSAGSRQP